MSVNSMTLTEARQLSREDLVGIYEHYHPEIYRYAARMLGDRDAAEDCVAETFSRMLQAVRGGGGPSENIRAYLFRVAHNWIVDYYRRNKSHHQLAEEDNLADPQGNPSHLVSQEWERERVRAAMFRLPPDQQQVIQLRFLEDWSHEEVAGVLGKTVEASRALQHRALASLRKMLLGHEEESNHEPH
jgi:RNA polymerase sigma-70 factor (ECF subfamily)